MGFRKEPTLYHLKFEDYKGLEITTRSVPLKDFLAINKMSMVGETDPQKQVEQSEAMFRKFSEALIGWNLEDENGKPVPATYNGLVSQEMSFVLEIVRAWMDSIANVPKLSKNDLSDTETYQEQLIPMEA